jgi:hypothetical protein
MRENGNQYGPRFQNVSSIWRAGDQTLGRLSVTRQHGESEPHYLDPCLLDSVTQLLAPFIMEKGKTFILRAIEKIEVTDVNFPDVLWVMPHCCREMTVVKRACSATSGSSTSQASRIWNSPYRLDPSWTAPTLPIRARQQTLSSLPPSPQSRWKIP